MFTVLEKGFIYLILWWKSVHVWVRVRYPCIRQWLSNIDSLYYCSMIVKRKEHYITISLLCYTCSYTANSGSNDSCIYEPQNSVICSKKYCTIIRQDLVHPAGSIVSFSRSCEDKPLYLNAVKTDTTYKMYFRSCSSDLCNDSDGKRSATNADPNFGASENMIIKGRDY